MRITSPPAARQGPPVAALLEWAADQVRQAAGAEWPGADVRLLEHVPSVTGYVQRVDVSGRTLYAKLSILGASLVSVLRGVHGSWEEVQQRQRAYAEQPDGLMQREAAHLRLLADIGLPRVAPLAGLRGGVLFTEAVPGPSMAERLTRKPGEVCGMLEAACGALSRLHAQDPALLGSAQTTERSIPATFARKFTGAGGGIYLRQIGTQQISQAHQRTLVVLLRAAVAHLARYEAPDGRTTVVYGDLKPEHVITAEDGSLVLLDPGLRLAGEVEDLARLVSRTVLLAVATMSAAEAAGVIDGVDQFVSDRSWLAAQPGGWFRSVVALWLMDTLNILSTYLTAPADLPLPGLACALADHAVPVAATVHEAAIKLGTSLDGRQIWQSAVDAARKAAQL